MSNDNIIDMLNSAVFEEKVFKDKELVWKRIKEEIANRKHTRVIRRKIVFSVISVAAMICIIITLFSTVKFESFGKEMAYILPDGTEVSLNKHSSVSYNRFNWMFERKVNLSGNASFHVIKGNPFTVNFSLGSVTVLGTKFVISQGTDSFTVVCTEGSVMVKTNDGEQIIKAGERVNGNSSGMIISKEKKQYPEFLEYDDAKLSDVLKDLSDVYDIIISDINDYDEYRFSGFLTTKNSQEALTVLSEVCQIQFSIKGKEIIITR